MSEEKSEKSNHPKTSNDHPRAVTAQDDNLREVLSKIPTEALRDMLGSTGMTEAQLSNLPQEALLEIYMSFAGPLPPPVMFKQYEEILPGAAGRIMKMAENEQDIRIKKTHGLVSNDNLRIWGSIVVSLTLIAGAVYCAIIGQQILGGILGFSGVLSIIPELVKSLTKVIRN